MASEEDFALSFKLLIGHEGGYTNNPSDPGNWTGGKVNSGTCKGTNYGISAASYPDRDIAALTLDDAMAIYRRDYWRKAGCDDLPARAAFIVFDAAVNNGVGRAVKWLQSIVGSPADGAYGPATQRAVKAALTKDPSGDTIAGEFHANRLRFMVELDTWPTFRGGWSRRLAKIPLQAGVNFTHHT